MHLLVNTCLTTMLISPSHMEVAGAITTAASVFLVLLSGRWCARRIIGVLQNYVCWSPSLPSLHVETIPILYNCMDIVEQ